jgi:hypothetical protein
VAVTGNSVRDCNQGQNSSPYGAGIALRGASYCTVVGNAISGANQTYAIQESNPGSQIPDYNVIGPNDTTDNPQPVLTVGTHTVTLYATGASIPVLRTNNHFRAGLVEAGGDTGLANGRLRVSTLTPTTVGIASRTISGQTANHQEWLGANGTTVEATVSENNYFTTRKNVAPANAELSNGEAAYWFDPTNSAPKFMIKAKRADGTVVTGSIPLK